MPNSELDRIHRVDLFPYWKEGVAEIIRALQQRRRRFFQLTALKTPEFRRVARRIEGVRYFDVDRVPARFFEEAKYLAVDLVACVSADALAYTSGGYLHYNYFATSSGPQERFLFLSAEGLEELAAVSVRVSREPARRLCAPCGKKIKTPGLRQAVDAMLKWRNA